MWRTTGTDGKGKLLTLHTEADHAQHGQQWRRWASITSPYVVSLHDVISSDDGRWAVVQEDIPGQTLAMHCQTQSETVRLHGEMLIEHIRQGLQALHAAGIVHGDLSARNILVTDHPRAVIIDLLESASAGDAHASHSMEADQAALGELETLIRSSAHGMAPVVASAPQDPGARLRAQAQMPATEVSDRHRRWWPLPTTDRRGPRPHPESQRDAVVATQRVMRLSPARILTVGVVVASLLGGWGTVQLWSARADGPVRSPQAQAVEQAPSAAQTDNHENSAPPPAPTPAAQPAPASPPASDAQPAPPQEPTRPASCPGAQLLRQRLESILAARDRAYMNQDLSGLDQYLSAKLIDEDRERLNAMKEKDTTVSRFNTQIATLTNIHCESDHIHAEATFTVDGYTICTAGDCADVAPTPPTPHPLHIQFSADTVVLTSVGPGAH